MALALPKGTLGLDYSYYRPGGAAIAAAGYKFAMRYLSYEPNKNISLPELQDLHAHGIAVGFVWETNGVSILGGAGTGAVEGKAAAAELAGLGVPKDVPIFVAFDQDDRTPAYAGWQGTIHAYLSAFALASGHFAIPYGSNRVIDFFQSGWQTEAWSEGVISKYAALYQRASSQTQAYHSFPPDTVDEDVVLADQAIFFGPTNVPTPPAPSPSGDIVIYPGNVNANGPLNFMAPGVRMLQALLNVNGLLIAPNNVSHPVLIAAIKRVQEINGWPMTGVADERVWAWCLRKR